MKRLATLALAVILITGCNAMKPNSEETELLSKEIEKRIYAQVEPTKTPTITESNPAPAPIIVSEHEDEPRPVPSKPTEEPKPVVPEPAAESEEKPLQQAEPAPTPQPTPTIPAEPAPQPAVCSCGARLTPEEVLPHMKSHAMNGENHSYIAH